MTLPITNKYERIIYDALCAGKDHMQDKALFEKMIVNQELKTEDDMMDFFEKSGPYCALKFKIIEGRDLTNERLKLDCLLHFLNTMANEVIKTKALTEYLSKSIVNELEFKNSAMFSALYMRGNLNQAFYRHGHQIELDIEAFEEKVSNYTATKEDFEEIASKIKEFLVGDFTVVHNIHVYQIDDDILLTFYEYIPQNDISYNRYTKTTTHLK